MWHSNRFIPKEFWNQDWGIVNIRRKKVGIIMIKGNSEVLVTQSYHRCYGFPKGEKEKNESVEECAKREFLEEIGMNINKINLKNLKQVRTMIEDVEYIYFIIHVPKDFELLTFPIDDVEITSFGWKRINQLRFLNLSKAVKMIISKLN
tara:strand:- start:551 stop:997 length:447 start_codon:yes stop_codon:yes gene_type:complete